MRIGNYTVLCGFSCEWNDAEHEADPCRKVYILKGPKRVTLNYLGG
jgi:hypothetical protein